MKPLNITKTITSAALGLILMTQSALGAEMKTNEEIASYAIGHNIGNQVKPEKEVFAINIDLVLQGLKDGFEGVDSPLTGEQITTAFEHVQKLAEAKAAEAGKAALEKNAIFLAENAAKEGVITTDSGLQYEVLTKGTGTVHPTTDQRVLTHYHGTFTDGGVFDSSVERNEPIAFGVTQVIQGWIEALQLMVEGDKWRITVPSDLAYGPSGKDSIPPNTVLIFEMELIEIQ